MLVIYFYIDIYFRHLHNPDYSCISPCKEIFKETEITAPYFHNCEQVSLASTHLNELDDIRCKRIKEISVVFSILQTGKLISVVFSILQIGKLRYANAVKLPRVTQETGICIEIYI